MKILFLLGLGCLLSSCVTATKRYTADGEAGYDIRCGGIQSNWGRCYKKAEEICGEKGYIILEKLDKHVTECYTDTLFVRRLIIDCKK